MSVGSRRPTVSKQLRNYADNTPLSPGGKKFYSLTAISIAKSELVSKIFDPIFDRREKKKRREISSSDFVARSSFRNFKNSSTRGKRRKRRRRGFLRSFFWRQLFVVIRSKHPSVSFADVHAFRDTPHRRKETLDEPLASLPDLLSCRASPLLDANWQDRKQLDRPPKDRLLFFSFSKASKKNESEVFFFKTSRGEKTTRIRLEQDSA